MKHFVVFITLFLLLSACAEQGFEAIESTELVTTYAPPVPTQSQVGDQTMVDGALSPANAVKIQQDQKTAQVSGKFKLKPQDSNETIEVDLNLVGKKTPGQSRVKLESPSMTKLPPQDTEVGAIMTCLNDQDCDDSFVDIYVKHKGVIYHHQMEKKPQDKTLESAKPEQLPVLPNRDAVKPIAPQETEETEKPNLEVGENVEEKEEALENEPKGQFKGDKEQDIKELFPEKSTPKVTPKPQPVVAPTPVAPAKTVKKEQAIRSIRDGELKNPASLLAALKGKENPGVRILYPARKTYYATDELVQLLVKMGEFAARHLNYTMEVNDLSAFKGGALGSHKSHRSGLDVDIAYLWKDEKFRGRFNSVLHGSGLHPDVMVDELWSVLKYLVSTKTVDRIFIHKRVKSELCALARQNEDLQKVNGIAFQTLRRLVPDTDHNTHFHLRIECPDNQVKCQQWPANPPPQTTGCESLS